MRINDDQHQYGSINYAITGDLRVYGRVFVATNGRGIVYGEPSSDSPVPTPTQPPKDVGMLIRMGKLIPLTIHY